MILKRFGNFSKIPRMFKTLLEASCTFSKISRRFKKLVEVSDSSKQLLKASDKLYKIPRMFIICYKSLAVLNDS